MAATKRKNFLIDKGFQLKYAFLIAGVLIAMILVVEVHTYLTIRSILPKMLFMPNMLSTGVYHTVKILNRWLLINGAIYVVTACAASIYLSHRIAGPVFRLRSEIREIITNGDLTKEIRLRKGDEFSGLVDDMNDMIEDLRRKIQSFDRDRILIVKKMREELGSLDLSKLSPADQQKIRSVVSELGKVEAPDRDITLNT